MQAGKLYACDAQLWKPRRNAHHNELIAGPPGAGAAVPPPGAAGVASAPRHVAEGLLLVLAPLRHGRLRPCRYSALSDCLRCTLHDRMCLSRDPVSNCSV